MHHTLSRRYPTNDRMMRYRRMPHPVFTDTLMSTTKSAQGMNFGQAYCTLFGWTRCYPIKMRKDAHETLSLMFKCDDVLPRLIVDDSKEQTLGQFKQTYHEADCHMTMTEPYSPW